MREVVGHRVRLIARIALPAVLACLLAGSQALANPGVFGAAYSTPTVPNTVVATASFQVSVSLTNTGDEPWTTGGSNPVNLSYHWYDPSGTPQVWEGARTFIGSIPVVPLGKITVNANVLAPATAGQYTLRFALVKEGVTWFPPSVPLPIFAQAAYVAQVTANAVPPMIAGGTYTVVANLKNTGAAAWNFAGANPIAVSYHWHDASGNTVVWDGLRTPLAADIAPGATATAHVKVATPQMGGTYTLTVDLVRDGIGWLGGTGGSQPLRVPLTVDTARFAASYGIPQQLDTFWAEQKTLSVQITNTGNQTWSGAGPNPVNVSYHIFDSAGQAVLWDGPRTALGADMAPGTARAFTVGFTAPSASGIYTLAFDLVREGVGWFADSGAPQGRLPFSVTSGLNGGYGMTTTPAQVTIGAAVDLSVNVINYSGKTWPAAGANPVHLGYHIIGANSGTTYVWDGARGTLPTDVKPGTQTTVPMRVQLPANTGDYILAWDLVQEGVAWFSQVNVPMKNEPFTVVSGVVFYGSGVVEAWSSNTATPTIVGTFTSVAVVPLDPGNPLRFVQKDQLDGRPGFYRGNLRFTNLGNTLRAINAVSYDDYVRGVISFEMPNTWAAEALKAQAYAARSYAYASYRGVARDYDVSDDQADQCYAGVTAEGPRTDLAVALTAGKIVTWNNAPVKTYFASSSGGYTKDFGCWGTRVVRSASGTWICTPDASQPFLAAVPDPADRLVSAPANPRASWSVTFNSSQIANAVICAGGPNIGVLQGVDVTNRFPVDVGHAVSIRFYGSAANADVPA